MTEQIKIITTPQFEAPTSTNDTFHTMDSQHLILPEKMENIWSLKWLSDIVVYITSGKSVRIWHSQQTCDITRPSHYLLEENVFVKSFRLEITLRPVKTIPVIECPLSVLVECDKWTLIAGRKSLDARNSEYIPLYNHDNGESMEWKGEFIVVLSEKGLLILANKGRR